MLHQERVDLDAFCDAPIEAAFYMLCSRPFPLAKPVSVEPFQFGFERDAVPPEQGSYRHERLVSTNWLQAPGALLFLDGRNIEQLIRRAPAESTCQYGDDTNGSPPGLEVKSGGNDGYATDDSKNSICFTYVALHLFFLFLLVVWILDV